jgi:hypothetical protein
VLRIVGYQEHALHNVQPRRRCAKTDAADSNSSSIWRKADIARIHVSFWSSSRPEGGFRLSANGATEVTRAIDNHPISSRSQALFRSLTEMEHGMRQHYQ